LSKWCTAPRGNTDDLPGTDSERLSVDGHRQYARKAVDRPGVLAERAGVSKQAMNRLLRSLEDLGYLKRTDASGESRTRIVYLTTRGHAASAKILEILRVIEREWTAELGPNDFANLKQLLGRVGGPISPIEHGANALSPLWSFLIRIVDADDSLQVG
jgi:DNA-binding MarR family transcriptional regulator